jgi:hypothetical protein
MYNLKTEIIMPIITVDNASLYKTEEEKITLACQKAIAEIKELQVKKEWVKVLFHDCKFMPGTNTVIARTELFEDEKRTKDVLHKLSKSIGEAIKKIMPDVHVESFPTTICEETFWSSSE